MFEKETKELDRLLEQTKPEQMREYLQENKACLADDKKAFYYYMKDVVEAKNMLLKDIYSFAGVTESWGGKIITMERHTKNRDLILRFCVAGHFSLPETNRALKLYGMNPLYARDKRDACIIVAINNRRYDLADMDDLLTSNGYPKLSADI